LSYEKIFKHKLFIILSPAITFVLFFIAGFLLGYQPKVSGRVSGGGYYSVSITGSTSTEYVFMVRNAIGIWLIGLAIALLVFLVCVLIQKQYLGTDKK
jgi:hypothetical protein